jgi:hypothetical protein
MDAIEARNKADFERECATLKATYSALNKVRVGDVDMAIADRRLLVETALVTYAEANKATLIDDKKKSVKVNYGTFGWRHASIFGNAPLRNPDRVRIIYAARTQG